LKYTIQGNLAISYAGSNITYDFADPPCKLIAKRCVAVLRKLLATTCRCSNTRAKDLFEVGVQVGVLGSIASIGTWAVGR
jgi:hypothetical protein